MTALLLSSVASISLACTGSDVALLEHPVSFALEITDIAAVGAETPFSWVSERLGRREHNAPGHFFVGDNGYSTVEVTLTEDRNSITWIIFEPRALNGDPVIETSGNATCQITQNEAVNS